MKTLCISIIILTLLITGCGLMTVDAAPAPSDEAPSLQPGVQRDAVVEVPFGE
jgi:uncharacterized protein YceK